MDVLTYVLARPWLPYLVTFFGFALGLVVGALLARVVQK